MVFSPTWRRQTAEENGGLTMCRVNGNPFKCFPAPLLHHQAVPSHIECMATGLWLSNNIYTNIEQYRSANALRYYNSAYAPYEEN